MSRRKKLIKDSNLLNNPQSCFTVRIPLTPQSKEVLLHLAEKRMQSSETMKKGKMTVFEEWKTTPEGKKCVNLAYDIAAVKSYTEAHQFLFQHFLEAHPEFKTKIGRPPGAPNKESTLLLKVGEIIADMLNRCAHDL